MSGDEVSIGIEKLLNEKNKAESVRKKKQQRSPRVEIFKTGFPPDANAECRSFTWG